MKSTKAMGALIKLKGISVNLIGTHLVLSAVFEMSPG